jgi:hypothetical protein
MTSQLSATTVTFEKVEWDCIVSKSTLNFAKLVGETIVVEAERHLGVAKCGWKSSESI